MRIMSFAKPGAFLIALIKPQFEVGKGLVGKGGVARDPELHQMACADIEAWISNDTDWQVIGVEKTQLRGQMVTWSF